MGVLDKAEWITWPEEIKPNVFLFRRKFRLVKPVKSVALMITSLGVYQAKINECAIGDFVLAPGWTVYRERVQMQTYDLTQLVQQENQIAVTVGKGWYASPMPGWLDNQEKAARAKQDPALIVKIEILYEDESQEIIVTDENWEVGESPIRFSEIYDGESYDATYKTVNWYTPVIAQNKKETVIPQEGELIKQQERIRVKEIITTPKGELVIDFGQEITGFVEINLMAKDGEKVSFTHGECLDKEGNFYHQNYRTAKAKFEYLCTEGLNRYHAQLTFFGFRYLRIDEFPGTLSEDNFTAIALYSDLKQTGKITSGNQALNQLISNIFWSQKSNFVDVPTDCPQRDERLGWTGDALAFIKAASYNFDVYSFFRKWLRDVRCEQAENGLVPDVVPNYLNDDHYSAGWGDAITFIPWQLYQTYGKTEILAENYEAMKKWVDFITATTKTNFLWTGTEYFGDWLGLDGPKNTPLGASRVDFVASCFYAQSTKILIETGKILEKEMSAYETNYEAIRKTFQATFPDYQTQTEHVLALVFDLSPDQAQTAKSLGRKIQEDGLKMQTGFIGTPHLLHALSQNEHVSLAYQLLLKKTYPSWLFSVELGATTVWEHWDGINEAGEFWSAEMNSFNHYAYGAVIDWLYEEAGGIHSAQAGFSRIVFEPKADPCLPWLSVELKVPAGRVESKWCWVENRLRYEVVTPVPATVKLDKKSYQIEPGTYIFWGDDQSGKKHL